MQFDLKIDFAQLKEQKSALLELTPEGMHILNGLIYLIDSIQDQAVKVHGLEENEVFNIENE